MLMWDENPIASVKWTYMLMIDKYAIATYIECVLDLQ